LTVTSKLARVAPIDFLGNRSVNKADILQTVGYFENGKNTLAVASYENKRVQLID
jgi:hypothetical protein